MFPFNRILDANREVPNYFFLFLNWGIIKKEVGVGAGNMMLYKVLTTVKLLILIN
jgi:hypothetical protein